MSHPTLELKRAYLALRRALETTVKPFGMTGAQFDVLQLLMHVPEIEHRDLMRQLAMTSPSLTNIVDGLEQQGQVTRQTSPDDARVKTIAITPAARALCYSASFCAAGDQLVDRMFDGFSEDERTRFLALLSRVHGNLDRIGHP